MKSPFKTILLLILVLLLFVVWGHFARPKNIPDSHISEKAGGVMHYKEKEIPVEFADTPAQQTKGLSGRFSMTPMTGMLFRFTKDDPYPFWMPDMHFSIDIIWLNSSFEIVHIEPRISPETYPTLFSSPTPARFVLELPEGTARILGLKIGEKIELKK